MLIIDKLKLIEEKINKLTDDELLKFIDSYLESGKTGIIKPSIKSEIKDLLLEVGFSGENAFSLSQSMLIDEIIKRHKKLIES